TTARTRGWRRGSGITGGWNARAPADRSLACPADDRCATGAGRLARAGPRSRLWRRDLPLLPLLPGARAGLAPSRRASTATSLGGGAASGRSPAPVGPVAGTSATAASLGPPTPLVDGAVGRTRTTPSPAAASRRSAGEDAARSDATGAGATPQAA